MSAAGRTGSALPGADRTKLAKLLGLLSSTHAGERDAAALAATRLVRRLGLTWDAVIAAGDVQPAQDRPAGQAQGWRADLATCIRHCARLPPWEQEFVQFIHACQGASPPQAELLAELAGGLRQAGRQ